MFIGIVVSTGLNILIMPPDYTDNLKDKIHILRRKFEKLYQNAIEDLLREEKIEKETIKNKRQVIRNELDETRELYNLLLEDNIPKNRASLEKYRRSINAIQSNLDRLMAIPVSYTHLDVYKRQDAYRSIRGKKGMMESNVRPIVFRTNQCIKERFLQPTESSFIISSTPFFLFLRSRRLF